MIRIEVLKIQAVMAINLQVYLLYGYNDASAV